MAPPAPKQNIEEEVGNDLKVSSSSTENNISEIHLMRRRSL